MELFTNDRHLSDAALLALLNGELDGLRTVEAADHLAECAYCAGRLALAASAPETERPAPRGMTEQVRARIRKTEQTRRREFLRYCAGAVAGMAAVIALMFAAPIPHNSVPISKPALNLPEPVKQDLPEPVKLTLPEPEQITGKPEPEDGVLTQLDQYFRSLFGGSEPAA